jgi:hypothetical protein
VEIKKAVVDSSKFNRDLELPYSLRIEDFESAMRDVYDFFFDVNGMLLEKGLARLDEMVRPAGLSGTLSDMLSDSLASHARGLAVNRHHNGHPDLLVKGRYPGDSVEAGKDGVEIKASRKYGGAVDTHGARDEWMCVFTYSVDNDPNKGSFDREPLTFQEIYIAKVEESDFRFNKRGRRGTDTATLHRDGLKKLREGLLYKDLTGESRSEWRATPKRLP